MPDKTSRSVIVTGASRGIGAAVALSAGAAGFDVTISYQANRQAADDVVRQVESLGQRAQAVQADARDEAQTIALFDAHASLFGVPDAVVNNVGVVQPPQPFADYSLDRMRFVFDTNVLGAFLAAREAVRRMSTKGGGAGGSIVNISSVASKLGSPDEYIDYAASKGAMDSMTIGLAKEVAGQKIRVNAVRPGLIYTDIHASGGRPDRVDRLAPGVPMQRGGTAQEIADAVLWLMSDKASYVTGALIDVAGGR